MGKAKKKLIFSDMKMFDNGIGFGPSMSAG
jgi:hypothetical protein